MARPRKLTMDFFIHDANASSDKKIKLLSKKHGNDGYATYFRILESLCHEPGMQLSLKDPEIAELLAEDYRLRDIQHLYKIIQCCADIKLLDKQLWEADRIVFSHGLFNRYSDRLEDRKDAAIRKQRSREAHALQEKIDTLNGVVTRDNGVTIEMSQDCHSPETDPEIRTSEPITHNPKMGRGNVVQISSDIARFESQFRPQENPPWVVSRQGNIRTYDSGFKAHVVKYLSKLGCYKGKTVEDFDAVKWLNAANYTNNPDGQKRFDDVCALWEDYQAHLAKRPARPTEPQPIHDSNAVGQDVMAHAEWVKTATPEEKAQRAAEVRAQVAAARQMVEAQRNVPA